MTTEEKTFKSVWEGKYTVFGIDVRCVVFEDGKRLVNGDDLMKVLMKNGDPFDPELMELVEWQAGFGVPDEAPKVDG